MTKKLSRIVALMLAVIMSFSMLLVPVEAASFKDVSNKAWYKAAVDYVAERGWMSGVSSTTFAPNMKVTRGMAVTVLAKVAEADLSAYEPAFADTEAGKWYTKAAAWAADKGIVAGVGDGMFAPNRVITRQDLAAILNKFIKKQDYQIKLGEPVSFNDMDSVAGYATQAVSFCAAAGLVSGFEDSTFRPQQTATRAQLAVMMMKLDELRQGYAQPMPAQSFNGAAGEDMSIAVNAPEGALPENSTMSTSRVTDEAALNAIKDQIGTEVFAAADITFSKDGEELEPQAKVEVQISLDGLEALSNPVVYHLRNDGIVEHVNSDLVSVTRGGQKALRFYANDFSIYAVINENEDDNARLTVNFINNHLAGNDKNVATVYVKNSDVLLGNGTASSDQSYIEDIVADPGIGEVLGEGLLFAGWSIDDPDANKNGEDEHFDETKYGASYTTNTKSYTIEKVREYLANLDIKEGDTLNVYAMVFKVYSVMYLDEANISLGSDDVYLALNETSVSYKVSRNYTPKSLTQNFDGWKVEEGASNISNAQYNGAAATAPYKMGTTMNISGNVKFSALAPNGLWLTFDENAKGATYNAPQFVKSGTNTSRPTQATQANMKRLGYTFDNWYKLKEGHSIDDVQKDDDKNYIIDSTHFEVFEFGHPLQDHLTIYAKWIEVSSASYRIIYWKEKSDGSDYDFDVSKTASAAPRSAISVSSNGSTVTATGVSNYTIPTGFEFEKYDEGKKVSPQGNTIVNVYLKRKMYTLTFQAPPIATPNSGNNYQSSSVYIYDEDDGVSLYGATLYSRNGKWYTRSWGVYSEYTGGVYSSNQYTTVKTITARYEADISNEFPITGTNNVKYNNGERWNPYSGGSSVGFNKVMLKVMTMPAGNVTFRLSYPVRPLKTMNYYVEALEGASNTSTAPNPLYKNGATNTTVNPGTMKFALEFDLSARYNCVTTEDFLKIEGFTFLGVDQPANSDGEYIRQGDTINIYYTRDKYPITFFDGIYIDGDDNVMPTNIYQNQGQLKVVEGIIYGSSTDSYNKGKENYYEPDCAYDGFVLEGWYLDDGCTKPYTFTTMQKGGIKVYAKWRQIQYRVFLHPQAFMPDGNNDNTLRWGLNQGKQQAMNFRISYQNTLSKPTGVRDEYDFIGWYLDPEGTTPFNEDSKLTENIVTAEYDKTLAINWTDYRNGDPMDKFGQVLSDGYNSDYEKRTEDPETHVVTFTPRDRTWITKKLDLYGKWSAFLPGSDGISVIYDANGGSNAPQPTQRYKDNVDAIVQPASTPANQQTDQFLYWVLQTWDENADNEQGGKGAYVDTDLHVYPGATFTVLKANAKTVIIRSHTETEMIDGVEVTKTVIDEATYTVQLRAEYGPKKLPKKTHIEWFKNDKEDSEELHSDTNLQINQAVVVYTLQEGASIPTNPGFKFLGWARKVEKDGDDTITYYPNLNETDLFLKWVEATGEGDGYVAAHYEAKDAKGNWKTVTKIAADEVTPYEALYAVWAAKYYYIFHSSNGNLEQREVEYNDAVSPNAAPMIKDVDLTSEIPNDMLYGGYFKTYGGVNTDWVKNKILALESGNQEGWNNGVCATQGVSDANFEEYTGASMTAQSGTKFWTKAQAYSVNGEAMKPAGGAVYYLKEVPADYLATKMVYVYDHMTQEPVTDENGNTTYVHPDKLTSLYMISAIDDSVYSQIGFKVIDGVTGELMENTLSVGITRRSSVAKSLSFTTQHGPTTDPIKATDFNGVNGGLLQILRLDSKIASNAAFTVRPAWKTVDGVTVCGHTVFNVEIGETPDKNSITGKTNTDAAYNRIYVNTSRGKVNYNFQAVDWNGGNAGTKIWIFGDGVTPCWKGLTMIEGTGIGYFDLPSGYTKMIIVRYDPNYASYWQGDNGSWDNGKWSQTETIDIPHYKNYVSSFYSNDMGRTNTLGEYNPS